MRLHFFTDKIFANDIRKPLIDCYLSIIDGWIPFKVDKNIYQLAKDGKLESHVTGWIGAGCTYGGKWFGGLALTDASGKRDYQKESFSSIKRQLERLKLANFSSKDYKEVEIFEGAIVYCDPPYQGVTGYGLDFDHEEFWEWVLNVSKVAKVFVSEYNAPSFAKEIWSKEKHSPLNRTGKFSVEKLFVIDNRNNP